MKTENQIRGKITGLEGYIAKLKILFDEYCSKSEDASCFVREIERAYKEIHTLHWIIS